MMVLAALILIPAIALFLFYLQATCQRILRQQFNQEYFLAIANANRLEVPAVPHVGRIQRPRRLPAAAHDSEARLPDPYFSCSRMSST